MSVAPNSPPVNGPAGTHSFWQAIVPKSGGNAICVPPAWTKQETSDIWANMKPTAKKWNLAVIAGQFGKYSFDESVHLKIWRIRIWNGKVQAYLSRKSVPVSDDALACDALLLQPNYLQNCCKQAILNLPFVIPFRITRIFRVLHLRLQDMHTGLIGRLCSMESKGCKYRKLRDLLQPNHHRIYINQCKVSNLSRNQPLS